MVEAAALRAAQCGFESLQEYHLVSQGSIWWYNGISRYQLHGLVAQLVEAEPPKCSQCEFESHPDYFVPTGGSGDETSNLVGEGSIPSGGASFEWITLRARVADCKPA